MVCQTSPLSPLSTHILMWSYDKTRHLSLNYCQFHLPHWHRNLCGRWMLPTAWHYLAGETTIGFVQVDRRAILHSGYLWHSVGSVHLHLAIPNFMDTTPTSAEKGRSMRHLSSRVNVRSNTSSFVPTIWAPQSLEDTDESFRAIIASILGLYYRLLALNPGMTWGLAPAIGLA